MKPEDLNAEHLCVSGGRSMYFWALPCFFYLPVMNKEMIYQFTSCVPPLSLIPPLSSGELISCLTHAPRETGREIGRKMMGRRGRRGIRVARVKLETYPFNMSYLSILSVKRGTGGTTPMVQRPNSIQWWDRGRLVARRTNCSSCWGMGLQRRTPLPNTCSPSRTQTKPRGKGLLQHRFLLVQLSCNINLT